MKQDARLRFECIYCKAAEELTAKDANRRAQDVGVVMCEKQKCGGVMVLTEATVRNMVEQ